MDINKETKLFLAKKLLEKGIRERSVGNAKEALKALKKSANLFLQNNDKRGYAICLNSVAIIYSQTGKSKEAISIFTQLIPVAEQIKDENLRATLIGNIGLIYMDKGEFERAKEKFEESLEIYKRCGNIRGMGNQYGNLGLIFLRKGALDEAEKALNQALFYFESINTKGEIANTFNCLGEIFRLKGEIEKARIFFSNSLTYFKETGINEGVALALKNIGNLYRIEGQGLEAKKKIEESLLIYKRFKNVLGIASCFTDLGNIFLDEGNLFQAKKFYLKSLNLNKKSKNFPAYAGDLTNLGNIALMKGNLKTSLNFFNKAEKIYNSLSMQREAKILTFQKIGVHSLLGKYEECLMKLKKDIEEEVKFPALHAIFLSQIVEIEWKLGNLKDVLIHINTAKNELLKSNEFQRYLFLRLFEAEVYIKFARFLDAESIMKETEQSLKEKNFPFLKITLSLTNGSLFFEKSIFKDSLSFFSYAEEESKKHGFKILELISKTRAIESACEEKDGFLNEESFKNLIKEWKKIKIPSGIYDSISIYGDYLFNIKKFEESEKILKVALDGCKRIKIKSLEADTLFRLGKVYFKKEEKKLAMQKLLSALKIYNELNFARRIEKTKKYLMEVS